MKNSILKRCFTGLVACVLAMGLTPTAAFGALTTTGAPPSGLGAPGGFSGSSNVSWLGATTITSATTQTGKTYASTSAGQNAILVSTSGAVSLVNPTVTKSGGTSAGDNESFYGTNSAIMCKGGGTTTISGAKVTTSAEGANGVFSFGGNASNQATSGDGTTVVISDSTITTTGNGSGGIMTTGYGTTKATNLTVNTTGGSSAAIRTDRGGGVVTVDGGTYATSGVGSPAIYATAMITVNNATLTSTASQGVVNEGGNTVVLNNCTLNAGNKTRNGQDMFNNGVFLYQSMSGDASEGASVFTMTGGTLNNTYGHVFHVTNTSAAITLNKVAINNADSEGVFLSVCDDAWNGLSNKATVNATDQTIVGDVLVGSNSTAAINLNGSSAWSGKTSGAITSHKNASTVSSSLGTVKVTLADDALWVLTGNCTVSSLSGSGKINYNGHMLTIGSKTYSASNPVSGFATSSETVASSGSSESSSSAKNIADGKITLSKNSYAYTGKARKPAVTVTFGGTTLKKGADYTVTYKNNKLAGRATATVTGMGDYTGTLTRAFTVKPAKVTGLSVTSKKAGKIVVKWSKKKAVAAKATGYQIWYKVAGKSARTTTVKKASTARKTLSGLTSGKKATVKVRAYKLVGGKKYYGAWSAKKTVTVKS